MSVIAVVRASIASSAILIFWGIWKFLIVHEVPCQLMSIVLEFCLFITVVNPAAGFPEIRDEVPDVPDCGLSFARQTYGRKEVKDLVLLDEMGSFRIEPDKVCAVFP